MKLYAAFLVLYTVSVIIDGFMEAGSGVAATYLTANISAVATTLSVQTTEGFLASDYVVIGDERIRYTSRADQAFTVPAAKGRGYDGTTAVVHEAGAMVYTESTSVLNSILGYNVASTGATVGSVNLFTALWNFAFYSLPRILTWNFGFLQISPWLTYLRYLLIAITAAFTLWVIQGFAAAFGGIMRSIFVRG